MAACSLDRTGLASTGTPPPTGRADVSSDGPALGGGDGGAPQGTADSLAGGDGADDGGSAGGSDSADDGEGADSGDAAAVDLPENLDATPDATADGTDVVTGKADADEVGPPANVVGCADGAREGLLDLASYPTIAACAGGWQVPGLLSNAARTPACGRRGGNQGARPDGQGCSSADLCAAGWHVCESAAEVMSKGGKCADAVAPENGRKVFYATRQFGDANCAGNPAEIGGSGDNLVHGCGTFGTATQRGCAPLNFSLHDDNCTANPPWQCNGGNNNNVHEISIVTKRGATLGGVLCCKD